MFRQMVQSVPPASRIPTAEALFTAHPLWIAQLMEDAWGKRALTTPNTIPTVPPPPNFYGNLVGPLPASIPSIASGFLIDHLIYAYFVENSRILEIFRKVVSEFIQGEQLGVPPDSAIPDSHRDITGWLRTTETLFLNDPPPFFGIGTTSALRPEAGAVRRNAYFRMFGYDLNHNGGEGKPYPYVKPISANREFNMILERLLWEVWRGIVNVSNTSGKRDTDDAAIAALAFRLHDMMTTRRGGGNMTREEFAASCLMSWLHVTIMWDSPVVLALKASAEAPYERLKKIGERVGMPCHGRTEAFFELAPLMSWLLTNIESGIFNQPVNAPILYNTNKTLLSEIITRYSTATGRDIKATTLSLAARA